MLTECQNGTLVRWAPAKVNLFLEVLGRRPDGYHEIATLLVAVTLYDTLEFKEEAGGETRIETDDPSLPAGPDNLIWRAADALRRHAGRLGGFRVQLRKRIPAAAGLGGGSSDAAATLLALNKLWRLGLSLMELQTIAAEVGSDVPFFVTDGAAWCTGRGERVEPVAILRPLWLVLACPRSGLSTAEVYKHVRVPENPVVGQDVRRALACGEVDKLAGLLHNQLEAATKELCPEVGAVLDRLARLGVPGRLVSGSGSSTFALCRDRQEAFRVARELSGDAGAGDGPRVFVVRTCG